MINLKKKHRVEIYACFRFSVSLNVRPKSEILVTNVTTCSFGVNNERKNAKITFKILFQYNEINELPKLGACFFI